MIIDLFAHCIRIIESERSHEVSQSHLNSVFRGIFLQFMRTITHSLRFIVSENCVRRFLVWQISISTLSDTTESLFLSANEARPDREIFIVADSYIKHTNCFAEVITDQAKSSLNRSAVWQRPAFRLATVIAQVESCLSVNLWEPPKRGSKKQAECGISATNYSLLRAAFRDCFK
jgi:hypothetical protein